LEKVKNASSQAELLDNIKVFGRSASELMSQAAKRQQELKDPQLRDDLAAARAILKKHSTMLLTASKVILLVINQYFVMDTIKILIRFMLDTQNLLQLKPIEILF